MNHFKMLIVIGLGSTAILACRTPTDAATVKDDSQPTASDESESLFSGPMPAPVDHQIITVNVQICSGPPAKFPGPNEINGITMLWPNPSGASRPLDMPLGQDTVQRGDDGSISLTSAASATILLGSAASSWGGPPCVHNLVNVDGGTTISVHEVTSAKISCTNTGGVFPSADKCRNHDFTATIGDGKAQTTYACRQVISVSTGGVFGGTCNYHGTP